MLYFTCKGRRFYAGHTDELGPRLRGPGRVHRTGLAFPTCRQPIADLEGEPFAGLLVFVCPCGHRWHGHGAGCGVAHMTAAELSDDE